MMDEERSFALLKLLSDQKNHSLNDAVTLDPSCPAVEWHRLAQKLKHQGLVEHSWLKGETVITDAGVEIFQQLALSGGREAVGIQLNRGDMSRW
jgi:hypothetical protein